MKHVSVSEAKNTLSALIRKIRGGAVITITDRGVPVARLVTPGPVHGIPASAVELAQRGLLRLPERPLTADWDKGLPLPKPTAGGSVLRALLEERDSGL
jgi:prevent-host-death family protein